jgi:hypothetical protein
MSSPATAASTTTTIGGVLRTRRASPAAAKDERAGSKEALEQGDRLAVGSARNGQHQEERAEDRQRCHTDPA